MYSCLPAGEGPFPAVVMLHGTGSTKDEAGDGYKAAAPVLAEKYGIATIRIDFPGNGDSTAVAYYFDGVNWVQTTNVNACRQQIPENFKGWLYIPSTTFYGSDEKAGLGETFGDIFVENMRCYTDGYTYSADNYIIFDEIVFVK